MERAEDAGVSAHELQAAERRRTALVEAETARRAAARRAARLALMAALDAGDVEALSEAMERAEDTGVSAHELDAAERGGGPCLQ